MSQKLPEDENVILAKVASGNTRAFAIIYNTYRKRVYTVALQYLHSENQAEDAVQEVFLKLWRLEDNLTNIKNLEAYLLQLTKNKCLNMMRRQKLEDLYIEPLADGFDYADSGTEDQILLNDTRKIVNEGVAMLPPKQKLVYQLCRIQDLKYEKVGEKLNISPETVRSHLKLALKSLRAHVSMHTDLTVLLILFKII
jgi:RNA polymerase sigma-70 factor (family 1)